MSFFDDAIWNGDSAFEEFLDGNEDQFLTGDTPQVDQSSLNGSTDVDLSSANIGNEMITHSAIGAIDNPPSASEPILRGRNEQFALTNFNEASSRLYDDKLSKSATEVPIDFSNEVQPMLVGPDEPSFVTNLPDIGQNPSNLGGDEGSSANATVAQPLQDLGPLLLGPYMPSEQPQNIQNVLGNQSQEYARNLAFEEDDQESVLLANEMFLEQTTSEVSRQDASSTSPVNVNANKMSSGKNPLERSICSQSDGDASKQPTVRVQQQPFMTKPTSHAQEELTTSPVTSPSSGRIAPSKIQMDGDGKRKNKEGDGRVSKKNIPKNTTVYGVCSMKDAFVFTSNYPHVDFLPLNSNWNPQSRDLDVRRPQILQAVYKQDSYLQRLNENIWNISTQNELSDDVQTGKSAVASGISMNVMYDQVTQPHEQPINLSSAYTQISTLQQAMSGNTDRVQSSPINQEQSDGIAEFAVEDHVQELPIDARLNDPAPPQQSNLLLTPPESPETEIAKKALLEDKRFDLFLTEHGQPEHLELTESTDVSFTEMLAGAWIP